MLQRAASSVSPPTSNVRVVYLRCLVCIAVRAGCGVQLLQRTTGLPCTMGSNPYYPALLSDTVVFLGGGLCWGLGKSSAALGLSMNDDSNCSHDKANGCRHMDSAHVNTDGSHYSHRGDGVGNIFNERTSLGQARELTASTREDPVDYTVTRGETFSAPTRSRYEADVQAMNEDGMGESVNDAPTVTREESGPGLGVSKIETCGDASSKEASKGWTPAHSSLLLTRHLLQIDEGDLQPDAADKVIVHLGLISLPQCAAVFTSL